MMEIKMEYNRIKEALKRAGVTEVDGLTGDTDLREWIVDSMMFISFIVELENEFSIQIPDNLLEYDTIASVDGLLNIIESLKDNTFEDVSFNEEIEDLEREREEIIADIQTLELLSETKDSEEKQQIKDQIADKRTLLKDIECMILDLKM